MRREPGAPSYEERKRALIYSHASGLNTSVSSEPMLDCDPLKLYQELEPYITDSLWYGRPNMLLQRVALNTGKDGEAMKRARALLDDLDYGPLAEVWKLKDKDPHVKLKHATVEYLEQGWRAGSDDLQHGREEEGWQEVGELDRGVVDKRAVCLSKSQLAWYPVVVRISAGIPRIATVQAPRIQPFNGAQLARILCGLQGAFQIHNFWT